VAMAAAAPTTGCDSVLRGLFDGVVSPDAVAAACSASVEWDDLSARVPAVGRDAVRELLVSKFPRGSKLVIDRLADGQRSGGFTWHREAVTENGPPSAVGLRGTLFAELDADGQICYVREACEPILKPGEATEALLKAATKNADRPPKPPPTFTQRTPTGAAAIARYLWEDAYPGGAEPTEALRLFADNILYEDFNYPQPFVGKPAVAAFVTAFDIPGLEFVALKVSEGEAACCFTWKVVVNGQDGPQGLSFYQVDAEGRVCFVRDIPAPSPRGFRPLGALAARVDPALRLLGQPALTRAALGVGSAVLGLAEPAFAAEARWQSETLADEADVTAARAELDAEVGSAPVVVYTYGLSPFSSEALALLDGTGATYRSIELGPEWFLLNGRASAKRTELLERTGQSSLPHVFVGGQSIGGLYSGTPGLAVLQQQGELRDLLQEAGAFS